MKSYSIYSTFFWFSNFMPWLHEKLSDAEWQLDKLKWKILFKRKYEIFIVGYGIQYLKRGILKTSTL